ncbi:MAG: phosphoglucosamine mutase, partial [Planctomycetes bacterium]|nr:phosphoglucosamine mutase [Planctomycetota bacterium]
AAQFAVLVAQAGKPVSKINEMLPSFYQIKRKVVCPDQLKEKVLANLTRRLARYKPDRTDGLRVVTKDGWFIARPSGTGPEFRCFSEARTKEKAEELVNLGMKALEESVKAMKKK